MFAGLEARKCAWQNARDHWLATLGSVPIPLRGEGPEWDALALASDRLQDGHEILKRLVARTEYWRARAAPDAVVPERFGVTNGRKWGMVGDTKYYYWASGYAEEWKVVAYPYRLKCWHLSPPVINSKYLPTVLVRRQLVRALHC